MTREQTIKAKMQEAGTYDRIFDEEIHVLAGMERDLKRALSRWKAPAARGGDGGDFSAALWPVVQQLRKDVLAHYDSLGLTPKGMRRLKSAAVPDAAAQQGGSSQTSDLLDRLAELASANAGGGSDG